MGEYTEVIVDARSGRETVRPYTPTEIAASQQAAAAIAVPEAVTPRQVRLLLLSKGLLADVETMIAQQDRATQITWEFASEFRRNDPLLTALAAALGLSPAQVDAFFIAATAI